MTPITCEDKELRKFIEIEMKSLIIDRNIYNEDFLSTKWIDKAFRSREDLQIYLNRCKSDLSSIKHITSQKGYKKEPEIIKFLEKVLKYKL